MCVWGGGGVSGSVYVNGELKALQTHFCCPQVLFAGF